MKQTDDINEQVSALLDDELSPGEASRILDSLVDDPGLHARWDRYHLIGDVMRGEAVRFSADSVAQRVRQSLDQQGTDLPAMNPISISRARRFRGRWVKPASGAALAASVAILSVLAFPELTRYTADEGEVLASKQAMPGAAPILVESRTRWKNLKEPKVESKLNRYLIDHNEFADPGGMGVLPYTSFVSYDSSR
ncbi:MAG: sigma-E factor negative regulatory protein [Sedimenticola sp.]|nr:sigma-E factor negative regulatory protein [Sedimenticola sp.]